MDKQKVLNRLITALHSFLVVLDSENLSYIAQAQKMSISELLSKLKDTPVEDAEYMFMSCPSGTPSIDLRETQLSGTDGLFQSGPDPDSAKEPSSSASPEWLRKGSQGPAVPLHPPEGLDEDCYEEAEPFVSVNHPTDKGDSDSSHYESYGEEDEEFVKDRAPYIQRSASQPCLRPTPESRICGYLWRKKWLGQWTKQLFLVHNNMLLCYKCAKDLYPLLELNLQGCQVVYKYKHNKKMQHELKVVAGSDMVVIGFQSCQQAEEWRKIIEEVSGTSYYEPESQSSSSLLKCDRLDSCRSNTVIHTSDSDEEKLSKLPSALSSGEMKDKGFLNVLMNCQWQSLWCQVEGGVLKMYRDRGCEKSPQYMVPLRGCQVRPDPDMPQAYRITVVQHGDQVAVLEAGCADEKEQWVQLLQDGSVSHGQADSLYHHDIISKPAGTLSGLKELRFPTSNMYIDDPFHQLCGSGKSQPIYSNTAILEHMFQNSQNVARGELVSSKDSVDYSNTEIFNNHSRKLCEVELGVQELDLTGKRWLHLRAGSKINLITAQKTTKRTSFRQSLAFCTEWAQGGLFNPLLRRTTSAKNSLKRAPSTLFIEHGKVFQRNKEWETKAFN
ncbi:actin filament-associated protein 1-like 2 isoform X1 [Oncorhynchus tshawytscha]|uniref:PH domain-containing protein n=1 Tax=Oncorhynchus tshawytscha TaxID=74940 RepID=A0A8C8J8J2_ONCTS|nr:actin filament-associated protein 1-like 2 isoform X1 [Oncorhynchus tshawytscha]